MITIGQLARYLGVSTKTIRVYHAKGLLPEPYRDASGYRRYTATGAIALIKIRTLVEAGVPLARIRTLTTASDAVLREAITDIDADLTTRIRRLRDTRQRLRELAAGRPDRLPVTVDRYLRGLEGLGFSARWIALQRDLWLLVHATHPDLVGDLVNDQMQALTDPTLRQIFLDYDRAYDLAPDEPAVAALADRMAAATIGRYGTGGDLPGHDTGTRIPDLIQSAVNAASPAWRRIDTLVRAELHRRARPAPGPPAP
jgi:DNA-binding transcriptional MerR regulator